MNVNLLGLSVLIHGKQAINQANASDLFVEISAEARSALQQTLLDMYDDIRRICDRNHLTVFLAGGSALGAVRTAGASTRISTKVRFSLKMGCRFQEGLLRKVRP